MNHTVQSLLSLALCIVAVVALFVDAPALAAAVLGFAILAEVVAIRLAVTHRTPKGWRT